MNWKLEGVADSVPILGRGRGGLVEACRLPCMFQCGGHGRTINAAIKLEKLSKSQKAAKLASCKPN
jgi:hypothetical protein